MSDPGLGWQRVAPVEWDFYASASGGVLSQFPFLAKGDVVRARSRGEKDWRLGKVQLIWCGIEEMIDVIHDDGSLQTYWISSLSGVGDEMEMRWGGSL